LHILLDKRQFPKGFEHENERKTPMRKTKIKMQTDGMKNVMQKGEDGRILRKSFGKTRIGPGSQNNMKVEMFKERKRKLCHLTHSSSLH
jgi:hypothetical protein